MHFDLEYFEVPERKMTWVRNDPHKLSLNHSTRSEPARRQHLARCLPPHGTKNLLWIFALAFPSLLTGRALMLNRSTRAREISRRLPNAAILAILIALGIWGHHHHWRMPRFSELVGAVAAPHSAAPAATTNSENETAPASGGNSPGPSSSNVPGGDPQRETD